MATLVLLSSTVRNRPSMFRTRVDISLHKSNRPSKVTLSLGVSLLGEGVEAKLLLVSVAVGGNEIDPVNKS